MGQVMTEAEAQAWVTLECQATTEPCLTAEEVAHLTRQSRRADATGHAPTDPAWVPTWDLNWAAWRGWRMKAGKAVLMVDVAQEGGASVSKSAVHDHCLAMANDFARGVHQSSTYAPDLGEFALAPETNGPDAPVSGLGEPGTVPGVSYP